MRTPHQPGQLGANRSRQHIVTAQSTPCITRSEAQCAIQNMNDNNLPSDHKRLMSIDVHFVFGSELPGTLNPHGGWRSSQHDAH